MLIYSVVACGKTILAEHATGEGNFHLFAKQILENLPPDAEGKKSYPSQGYANYYFNFYWTCGCVDKVKWH